MFEEKYEQPLGVIRPENYSDYYFNKIQQAHLIIDSIKSKVDFISSQTVSSANNKASTRNPLDQALTDLVDKLSDLNNSI